MMQDTHQLLTVLPKATRPFTQGQLELLRLIAETIVVDFLAESDQADREEHAS